MGTSCSIIQAPCKTSTNSRGIPNDPTTGNGPPTTMPRTTSTGQTRRRGSDASTFTVDSGGSKTAHRGFAVDLTQSHTGLGTSVGGTSYGSLAVPVIDAEMGTALVPGAWTELLGDLPGGVLGIGLHGEGTQDEDGRDHHLMMDERIRATLVMPLSVSSAAFSRDAKLCLTGCLDTNVRTYQWHDRTDMSRMICSVVAMHPYAVTAVDISSDCTRIMSGGFDCKVMYWGLAPLANKSPRESDMKTVLSPTSSYTGDGVFSKSPDSATKSLGSDSTSGMTPFSSLTSPTNSTIGLSARLLKTLDGHKSAIFHACFCKNDNKYALTCGLDGFGVVWDLETSFDPTPLIHEVGVSIICGTLWRDFSVPRVATNGMVGLRAALCVNKWKQVEVWDVATRAVVQSLVFHQNTVQSVARSTLSGRLITASEDKTIAVWTPIPANNLSNNDLASVSTTNGGGASLDQNLFEEIPLKLAHGHPIFASDISENGRYVCAGDNTGSVAVWDLETAAVDGKLTISIAPFAVMYLHAARIRSVKFSADASYLMSASRDKQMRLVDMRLKERRAVLTLAGSSRCYPSSNGGDSDTTSASASATTMSGHSRTLDYLLRRVASFLI